MFRNLDHHQPPQDLPQRALPRRPLPQRAPLQLVVPHRAHPQRALPHRVHPTNQKSNQQTQMLCMYALLKNYSMFSLMFKMKSIDCSFFFFGFLFERLQMTDEEVHSNLPSHQCLFANQNGSSQNTTAGELTKLSDE